jgi:SAM-dependent methyltransferase
MSIHRAARWYDKFAKVYDNTNDYPYKPIREKAIQSLSIQPENIVLDLFCGTGVNFQQIWTRLKGKGTLIGIDGSGGMLQRAKSRIQKNHWNEEQIILLQRNLQEMKTNDFEALFLNENPVKVLMTLGAAGLPGWEPFWDNLCRALPNGSQIVTMDVYCPKKSFSGYVINFFGSGSFWEDVSSHKPWERLKSRCLNYKEDAYYPFRFLKCPVVVATGTLISNPIFTME